MIEHCTAVCTADKYTLFLDTLTMIGTLLMAGAAIGAVGTWRQQKFFDLAHETHTTIHQTIREFSIALRTARSMIEGQLPQVDFKFLETHLRETMTAHKDLPSTRSKRARSLETPSL